MISFKKNLSLLFLSYKKLKINGLFVVLLNTPLTHYSFFGVPANGHSVKSLF